MASLPTSEYIPNVQNYQQPSLPLNMYAQSSLPLDTPMQYQQSLPVEANAQTSLPVNISVPSTPIKAATKPKEYIKLSDYSSNGLYQIISPGAPMAQQSQDKSVKFARAYTQMKYPDGSIGPAQFSLRCKARVRYNDKKKEGEEAGNVREYDKWSLSINYLNDADIKGAHALYIDILDMMLQPHIRGNKDMNMNTVKTREAMTGQIKNFLYYQLDSQGDPLPGTMPTQYLKIREFKSIFNVPNPKPTNANDKTIKVDHKSLRDKLLDAVVCFQVDNIFRGSSCSPQIFVRTCTILNITDDGSVDMTDDDDINEYLAEHGSEINDMVQKLNELNKQQLVSTIDNSAGQVPLGTMLHNAQSEFPVNQAFATNSGAFTTNPGHFTTALQQTPSTDGINSYLNKGMATQLPGGYHP